MSFSMEEHNTPYTYQPIVAEDEIRILRLEPGAFAEPLVASIFSRKIEIDLDAPGSDYDAVSYCWGPQESFKQLRCGSQSLRISIVVEEMLRYLRKSTQARNLWIDASTPRCSLYYLPETLINLASLHKPS
jgi:hypothetical protein